MRDHQRKRLHRHPGRRRGGGSRSRRRGLCTSAARRAQSTAWRRRGRGRRDFAPRRTRARARPPRGPCALGPRARQARLAGATERRGGRTRPRSARLARRSAWRRAGHPAWCLPMLHALPCWSAACAAARRSLQTLARAGSRRAASGRSRANAGSKAFLRGGNSLPSLRIFCCLASLGRRERPEVPARCGQSPCVCQVARPASSQLGARAAALRCGQALGVRRRWRPRAPRTSPRGRRPRWRRATRSVRFVSVWRPRGSGAARAALAAGAHPVSRTTPPARSAAG